MARLQRLRADEIQDEEAVVLSVDFPNDQEGEAFVGHFNRKEPAGLTPPGV